MLLGQFLFHPERLAEVALEADAFHGSRRTLFLLLRTEAAAGRVIDFPVSPVLRAAGLTNLALACHEEWDEYPVELRELEARLHERQLRRKLDRLGEFLLDVTRDPTATAETLHATARAAFESFAEADRGCGDAKA